MNIDDITHTAHKADDSNLAVELQLSLYENAVDSIQHAIEHYTQDRDERRRYKYTLLHLAQGVMLLLKERLKREHPCLIFNNVADDSKTIDIETTVIRLEKIAKVDLGNGKGIIQELARVRNGIEHYAVAISRHQADSIIGRLVPFLVEFCQSQLGVDFAREIGDDTWQALLSIEDYLVNAIRGAEQKIKAEGIKSYFCKRCRADTAIETATSHTNSQDRFAFVSCLVCGDDVFVRATCRECGEDVLTDPWESGYYNRRLVDRANIHNYCSKCIATMSIKYPDLSQPLFGAEVARWFHEHDTISSEQLMVLLATVQHAGPTSRPRFIKEIFDQGYIDFSDEIYRRRYIAVRGLSPYQGFTDYYQFMATDKLRESGAF